MYSTSFFETFLLMTQSLKYLIILSKKDNNLFESFLNILSVQCSTCTRTREKSKTSLKHSIKNLFYVLKKHNQLVYFFTF